MARAVWNGVVVAESDDVVVVDGYTYFGRVPSDQRQTRVSGRKTAQANQK